MHDLVAQRAAPQNVSMGPQVCRGLADEMMSKFLETVDLAPLVLCRVAEE
jgi:hypothetical protein